MLCDIAGVNLSWLHLQYIKVLVLVLDIKVLDVLKYFF